MDPMINIKAWRRAEKFSHGELDFLPKRDGILGKGDVQYFPA